MSMKRRLAILNEAERKIQEQARNHNRLRVWNWKKKQLIGGAVPVVIFGDE